MTGKQLYEGYPAALPGGAALPSPDAMLGAWTSWMEQMTQSATQATQAVTGAAAGIAEHGGGHQALAQDPFIRSMDQVWNANPLREVIPVDWGGAAWALRTVWLRRLRSPADAVAAAIELNTSLALKTLEAWNDAALRWWGLAPGDAKPPADKRFAAPDWQTNPAYRSLRDAYLLASDWLLGQADAAGGDDMDPAERTRLNFHLRQFVDAMSPTLMLAANPAAMRRAFETGGASLADGARNLLQDVKAGRLSMVDADAFAPGRNLALSPGKVVYRNKLIELIEYSPITPMVHKRPLLSLPLLINK